MLQRTLEKLIPETSNTKLRPTASTGQLSKFTRYNTEKTNHTWEKQQPLLCPPSKKVKQILHKQLNTCYV